MALNAAGLEALIKTELEAAGIKTTGEHAQAAAIATAVANAVVAHIQSSAQVVVAGGSSSGTYPVL